MMHSAAMGRFRTMAMVAVVVASLGGADLARAQANARPAFEVATLKPSADRRIACIVPEREGDRFTCHGAPLSWLIAYAYNVPVSRIEVTGGGLYSVDAKIDPSVTEEQARLMLRALLEERLKLVARMETREMQGYTLVIAKGGLKIKEADSSAEPPPWPPYIAAPLTYGQGHATTANVGGGILGTVGRNAPISQLTDELSNQLKVPVVDRTGLTGRYYFELKFQNPAYQVSTTSEDYTPAADLSTALPEQLGLRLEKAKVQADYLVVEHWEQPRAE